jgi:TP901 family phage tail tape measure protein
MSRKIHDEDLRLNLILNGEGLNNGSKKMVTELGKMEMEMTKMEQKAKGLAASIKTLEKNATANASTIKTQKAEYNKLTQAMRAHQQSIEAMRKQVGLAGMTVQQLRNHLNALKLDLWNRPGMMGTPVFKQLQKEIAETEIRLRTLTTGASRFSQAWERLEKAANRAGTIMGWAAVAVFAFTRVISGVITRMKDLEDLIGSVRKNTNMLVGDVWDMKDAFDRWDTRTKTDDLLQMAVVAGKLGVKGKADIMDFVDSANKIQIALGDDLNGSVEDTVNSIGKLTNAFRVLDEVDKVTTKNFTLGSAMIRTGDVLNELAKSSAASAGTILEYMTRLSGVSELSKFTIAQIGGLGSVLDALNVPSERGATALQKIMLQLANPKKIYDYAEALNVTADGYKRLLMENPNDVLIKLLNKFVSIKNGLVELTGGLKDFGVKGQYMTAVLGSLAQNTDVLAKQQEIATYQWENGGSVLEEYQIMNNNFTADIEKQQKIIRAQTDHMNREAEPAVVSLFTAWAKFVVAIREVTDFVAQHWTAVKNLTFAYIALNLPTLYRISLLAMEKAADMASIVVTRIKLLWMNYEIITSRNLSGAKLVLLRNSKFLTIANIAYTQGVRAAWAEVVALTVAETGLAMSFAAAAGAIAILVGAFYFLILRQKELSAVEKARQALQAKIVDDYTKQKATLDVLMGRLKDVNASEEEKLEILKKIKSEYGQYLPLLEQEGLTAKDVADSYNLVVDAMARKIIYDETFNAQVENRTKMLKNQKSIDDLKKKMESGPKNSRIYSGTTDPVAEAYKGMEENLRNLEKIQREYILADAKFEADIKANAPTPKKIVVNGVLTTPEDEITFKNRQAKREKDLKAEEVAIKEEYARKKGLIESMEKELRDANLAYLNESIADYEKSGRIEEDAYMTLKEKRADLLLEAQKQEKKVTKEQKDAILELEKDYGLKMAQLKKQYLDGEISTEAEYNDRLLFLELEFLANKMKIYKVGSKEYLDAYNELLSKKISVEKNIEDKIASAQKQFAKIKIERLGNEIDQAKAIENQRWEDERAELEKQLIIKKNLSIKELEYNGTIWQIIEAKALEHKEKIRKINAISDQHEVDRLKESLQSLSTISSMTSYRNQQDLKEYHDKKSALIKKQYEEEKRIAGANEQMLNDAERNYQKQNFDLKVEMFNAEVKMHEAKIQMAQQYVDALRSVVGEQSDLGKALFLLGRGIAIADIWIKTASTNAMIYSVALEEMAYLGPVAPAAAAAWSAAPIAANNSNAALNTGLILAQTIGDVVQWATGKYPVIGASDGRGYNASYGGYPRTGVYDSPTLLSMSSGLNLVGERAPELVVDGDTLRRIQLNSPSLIRDIYAYAGRTPSAPVKQMAEGSYPSRGSVAPTVTVSPNTDALVGAINRLNAHLDRGINAKVAGYGGEGSVADAIKTIKNLAKSLNL